MAENVEIFTDGACNGNPGAGGWAALIREGGKEYALSGAEPHTTNQRMELTAAIKALETLKERREVKLYSDSEYLVNGMNEWIHSWIRNGWKTSNRKPVQNQDLWQRLMTLTMNSLFTQWHHNVEWIHVPGHAGHPENERVDQLAQEATKRYSNG